MKLTELTEEGALRAYAKMLNTLSVEPVESILAEDFCYASQVVLAELTSKQAFLNYIRLKLQTVAEEKATVYAEMGTIDAFGRQRPCVILAQYDKENLVGLVFAKVENGKLKRLDLCVIPSPRLAVRSGEYPV